MLATARRVLAHPGVRLGAALVALKGLFYALDTTIRLYLGDSAAYLHGARDDGRLPDDRSFVYSLLIRLLVNPFDDLRLLLVWQTLAGIAIAALVYAVLRRRFGIAPAPAMAAACAIAIEPAQVYYERMVLAETFGLLAFVAFFAAAAAYLASGRWPWLVAVTLLGLAAATLRLNYLAVAIVIALALPLLRALSPETRAWRRLAAHLLIAACAVAVLHTAYRQTVALIFNVPPGYIARAGFMQLGLVTPLVQPRHFERVGLPGDFARRLRYPLSDPDARMRHMWTPGGLVRELARHGVDVERVARQLSSMAIADDPIGLLRLGVHTLGGYFRPDDIEHALHNDLGRRDIPYEVIWTLREVWRYDATGLSTRVTPVSVYFEAGTPWLVACLFALPVLSLLNMAVHWRTPRRPQAALAGLVGLGLFVAHLLFVNVAFYRYLHPMPVFLVLNGVPAIAALRRAAILRRAAREAPGHAAGARVTGADSVRAESGPS